MAQQIAGCFHIKNRSRAEHIHQEGEAIQGAALKGRKEGRETKKEKIKKKAHTRKESSAHS